jgi:4'-phosphopantetheinyl transferase
VHLWRTRLPAGPPDAGVLADLPLRPDERARAARFRRPEDAARFAHSRSFLRRVLARYLGVEPEAVALARGVHGKPELAAPPPLPLRFNLSHSRDVAVCAVCRDHPVGVDVEAVRELPDLERLVRRHLTDRERRVVEEEGDDPAARLPAFYRIWARKEALLKGIGVGFAWGPAGVCVHDSVPSLVHPEGASEGAASERARALRGWRLHDLPAPAGFAAALAVRRGGMDLVEIAE